MKYKILLPLLLLTISLFAQTDYAKVDAFVKKGKFNSADVPTLTKELTQKFDTDTEKLRAIYIWITDNIAYDCKKYHSPMLMQDVEISARTEAELQAKIAAYEADAVSRTLKKNKGICEDYSQLFELMCNEIGIESKTIIGHTRMTRNSIGKIPKVYGHTWNSVKVDGNYLLIDATWGAGTVDDEVRQFTKKQRDGYFLVAPKDLIMSHFPKDPKNQYLDPIVDKVAFSQQPYVDYGFHSLAVQEYSPKQGIIELNEKTVLKLKLGKTIKPANLHLFAGSKHIQSTVKEKGGFYVVEFDVKKVKGKVISLVIQQGAEEFDEVISYKLR